MMTSNIDGGDLKQLQSLYVASVEASLFPK